MTWNLKWSLNLKLLKDRKVNAFDNDNLIIFRWSKVWYRIWDVWALWSAILNWGLDVKIFLLFYVEHIILKIFDMFCESLVYIIVYIYNINSVLIFGIKYLFMICWPIIYLRWQQYPEKKRFLPIPFLIATLYPRKFAN